MMIELLSFAMKSESQKAAEVVGAGIGMMLLLMIFCGLVAFGFWVWTFINCVQNKKLSDSNRTVGLVLILAIPLVGCVIYFLLPREKEDQR